jgi:hypothetical protein
MAFSSSDAYHLAIVFTYLAAGLIFARHIFSSHLATFDPSLLSVLTSFEVGIIFLLLLLLWPVLSVIVLFIAIVGKIGQIVTKSNLYKSSIE